MRKHAFAPRKRGKGFSKMCYRKNRNGALCLGWKNHPCHTDTTADDPTVSDTLTTFSSGATRSAKAERRELIPATAMDALARRLALGAKKHGVNNWRKGTTDPEFRLATINHLLDHIFAYLESGGAENTDAIICNAAFLCHFEAAEPYKGVVEV